jgi:hypothetical protein
LQSQGDSHHFLNPHHGWCQFKSANDSQESTASSELLFSGMVVELQCPGIGEVGEGSIVEMLPTGQWLGVVLPIGSLEFVLVRPSSLKLE